MSETPAYTVHAGDIARDRDTVLAIWRGNLGQDARMAAKYDWFYRDSPFGAPLLLLLRHEASGAYVGVASAGPRPMRWRGRDITAGVLVDLAVLPEHRSLGPALSLQQALVAAGVRQFDVMYGFPNSKAAPVFKRVGYVQLAVMGRHARVLRHGAYLGRRLPGWLAAPAGLCLDLVDRLRLALKRAGLRAEWSARVVPDMDPLWQHSAHGDGPVAVRDSHFLRWRFDASPLIATRYLLLRDDAGRLRAWFACQADAQLLHVRDAWSDTGVAGPSVAQIAGLLRAARAAGHDAVSVEYALAGPTAAAWAAAGFVERGQRPVYGRLGAGLGVDVLPTLHLSSADEDE